MLRSAVPTWMAVAAGAAASSPCAAEMGCVISTRADGSRRRPWSIGEVAVFVPGIRLPRSIDFDQVSGDGLSKILVGRLSALRSRVVVLAAREAPNAMKPRQGRITRHGWSGGSAFGELRQALEQYLPVLLGFAEDGSLRDRAQFKWANQEDDAEETTMSNAWYEVLSVLHLMAMLCLSEANLLLLPEPSSDANKQRVSEERKRRSVDVFLKAAGYLDCTIRHVVPQLSSELRSDLPVDLTEGVLQALCMQALGQGVDVQLGMAIDSLKATLAVKRRLACEIVKYWHQAQNNIIKTRFLHGWGEKHQLYITWKYAEAKTAAYYFHSLMLDEGNTKKSHDMAVAALHAAEQLFIESNKACQAFHAAPPKSRNPPLWGSAKYFSEKIPKEISNKIHVNKDLYSHERILETAPILPEFELSLKPDEYELPPLDFSWKKEDSRSSLKLPKCKAFIE